MTSRPGSRQGARVGFFGRLGCGNYGNDASFRSVLDHVRVAHPDVVVDAMASGPAVLLDAFDVPARNLSWDASWSTGAWSGGVRRMLTAVRIGAGLLVDASRVFRWTKGHDLVIIPGMGTFELTMRVRPWELPWLFFVLGLSCRAHGCGLVALDVGVSVPRGRLNRFLLGSTLKMARYRSYRDTYSRRSASQMGIETDSDAVYPDLAFGLPAPATHEPTGIIGVGVIAWHGDETDLGTSSTPHGDYLSTIERFMVRLVDGGSSIRLLIGDDIDIPVARELRSAVLAARPGTDERRVLFEPVADLESLTAQVESLDALVASRFHNLVAALRCGVPCVAVGYAEKHRVLLTRFGQERFVHSIRTVTAAELMQSLDAAIASRQEIAERLRIVAEEERRAVAGQFAELDDILASLPGSGHR